MRSVLLILTLSFIISSCDMGLFDRWTKKNNPFETFDKSNHLKPKISKSDFYQQTGFDFGWRLLEPINIAQSPDDEPELSNRLSPGQKALYFWWYLDGEVTNGGFIQFYFNGKEKYVPAIIAGMELIGDKEMADLVRKAQDTYGKNIKTFERAWSENSSEAFSELYEKVTDLSELDDIYYTLNNQTMSRIEVYAKRHPFEFCVDEDGKEFKENFSGAVKGFYENGNIKDSFNLTNGVIDGKFISYYQNGRERSLNSYERGELLGEQKLWYEDGTLKSKILIDNQRNKTKEEFYPNGQLKKLEHTDKKDEKKGIYKEWWDNGQLKEQAEFVGNIQRVGPWTKYHKDGHVEMEAEFKNGDVLFHNYWNEKGKQLLKNGTGLHINEFDMDMVGTKVTYRYETEYKGYKRDGLSRSFNNGIIQLTQEFKDGLEHGTTENYADGKLTEVKTYDRGKLVSTKKIE
jgi:antitoxin component YwqK of YwqJK toxin-antitoxin module